jgi:hypothetical protein
MPIDPRISLGVQPIQLADPVARYGQLATIQNAQNQNALAQYQLGAAKRSEDVQNVLADAYSQSTDPATGQIDYNKLTKIVAGNRAGAQIPAILKTRREMEQAELTQRETGFKVEKAKNEFIAQAKRDTSQNPSDANLTAFKEDLIANPLFSAAEKTQMAANVDRILAMPVNQRRSFMASQGASAGELKPTVQTVNRSGQTDVLSVPAFSGSPTTLSQLADVPLPADVQAQKMQVANAGAARSITNVNAFTPASEEAQRDFIKSTRTTYDALKNAPSTLKNIEEAKRLIPSAKGFMGPGGEPLLDAASFLNNRLGTKINTQGVKDATELRSRLFQGIIENLRKLDANPTENQQNALRTALGNVGTDPNALPAVLDSFADTVRSKVDMHNAEVGGAVNRGVKFPYDPTIKLPAPKTPEMAGPKVGTEKDGYRFKGGNPADPKSWEKM